MEVFEALAAVVGSNEISAEAPLMEAGVDSLSAVELAISLSSRFGLQLDATVAFGALPATSTLRSVPVLRCCCSAAAHPLGRVF